MNDPKQQEELVLQTVHTAEVDRAFGVVAMAWENPNISVDEMCEHLDAIGKIITNESTFTEFVTENNLQDLELIN